MKLEPVKDWVIGRIAIIKRQGTIVDPNATSGITRCFLLEEVSPKAAEAGYAPGDIVVALRVYDMTISRDRLPKRVVFSIEEIICRVRDVSLSEFVGIDEKPLVPAAAEVS